MKKTLNIIFTSLMALYPTFVFFALSFTDISTETIAIGMLVICGIAFLLNIKTSNRYTPLFACIIAVLMLFSDAKTVLKFYPIGVVFLVLWAFGITLFQKNTIVFGFARFLDSSILDHPGLAEIKKYCRRITEVWCAWFIVNIIIDFVFVFSGDFKTWAIFNGPICLGVQIVIFVGEFIARYFFMKALNRRYGLPKPGFFDMFRNIWQMRKKLHESKNSVSEGEDTSVRYTGSGPANSAPEGEDTNVRNTGSGLANSASEGENAGGRSSEAASEGGDAGGRSSEVASLDAGCSAGATGTGASGAVSGGNPPERESAGSSCEERTDK